jgi:hypothetical protein
MSKLFSQSFNQKQKTGKRYAVTADKEIWTTLANRTAFYIRDTDYDFVESLVYFRLASDFYRNYYDELHINEKGFNVR